MKIDKRIGDWGLGIKACLNGLRDDGRLLPVLGALLLAACQGRANPPALPEAAITVTFRTFGDPAERDAYVALVAAFHQQGPDIRIELSHIPSPREYRTRLITDFAAGAAPDISLMNYRRFAAFAANDLLEPLGPFVAGSAVLSPGDFYPVALEAFQWQGELMCLPQNISSLVVYYNQALFDAAGLAYPPDDWTWDDFVATARALTRDHDGDGAIDQYGLGLEPSLYRLTPFIWQNEGPLVDNPASPGRLTLTRFPSLQALEWFVSLRQAHGVVPGRVEEVSLDSESRFVAGLTAMFLNSRRGVPAYREIEGFAWDVAPLPRGRVAAGILHSDGYCLSRQATHKDAAMAFIEFANSEVGQRLIAGTGRTVPSLMAVAESEAFLDPTRAPARSRVWLDTVTTLGRVPVMSTWEEIESVASEEIERAFYGDISPAEAAQLAVRRTEEYFLLAHFAAPQATPAP